MRLVTIWLALVVLLGEVVPSAALAQGYRIQPGDLLRIEVMEDATINREVLVAPDGRINLPLAGNIRVSGADLTEAAQRVETALKDNFNAAPHVMVSLVQVRLPDRPLQASNPTKIYVLGEVKNPGAVDIEEGLTFLQSIAMAGGVTDFAATRRIQLRRVVDGAETVYALDYKAILDGQSGLGLTLMEQGDVVIVPPRRLFE